MTKNYFANTEIENIAVSQRLSEFFDEFNTNRTYTGSLLELRKAMEYVAFYVLNDHFKVWDRSSERSKFFEKIKTITKLFLKQFKFSDGLKAEVKSIEDEMIVWYDNLSKIFHFNKDAIEISEEIDVNQVEVYWVNTFTAIYKLVKLIFLEDFTELPEINNALNNVRNLNMENATVKSEVTKELVSAKPNVNLGWEHSIKKQITKRDFIIIVFGPDKYDNESSVLNRLLGNEIIAEDKKEEILQKYFENQGSIDMIFENVLSTKVYDVLEQESNDDELNFSKAISNLSFISPLSPFVGTDQNKRLSDSGKPFVFLDLNDKDYKRISVDNFVPTPWVMRKIEWHIFNAWCKGLSDFIIVYFNKEDPLKQYHLSMIEVSQHESKCKVREIEITKFLKRNLGSNNE